MRNTAVRCSRCDRALTLPGGAGAGALTCARCGAETRLWLFPALFRGRGGGEAQRAVAVCDGCGKFLCALCDIDWSGEHLCSACIEHRGRAGGEEALRTEYVHYDRLVLALAAASFVLYFIGVILAPIALFIGWRYWNEPWRPVPHGKFGMIAYMTLAFLILLGWGTLIVYFFANL